ncbi:MAG: hypothetical protein ABIN58_05860 [candidate division WOR-3 bacterium]
MNAAPSGPPHSRSLSIMITQILLTGDVLRPPLGAQDVNIRWMYELLRSPLEKATGLPVAALCSDAVANCIPAIYGSYGKGFDTSAWAAISCAEPSDVLCSALRPHVERSLVLCFECPSVLSACFRRLGVPLIEILVHPVRFYFDLLLAFRCSVPSIQSALSRFRVEWSELVSAARLIRDRLAGKCLINEDFSIITVQVPWDRSVILEGKFASILDFPDALDAFLARSKKVFIKPHPDIGIPEDVAEWASELAIEPVNENFYSLVSSPRLHEVLSLSSSTLDEAEAFGVRTTRLLPRVHRFTYAEDALGGTDFGVVYEYWSWPAFWSEVLSSIIPTQTLPWQPPEQPRTLRESRGLSWDWRPEFLPRP